MFSHCLGLYLIIVNEYQYSNNTKYFDGAQKAFEYERYYFNKEAGNWPDFRIVNRKYGNNIQFSTQWCHGAPGIGLSRLRAYELTKDEKCKQESVIVILTTIKELNKSISSGNSNYILCHGIGGNTTLLTYAKKV